MSWNDYNLVNKETGIIGVSNGMPIKLEHLQALQLATNERIYVCKSVNDSLKNIDLVSNKVPFRFLDLRRVDDYIWEILPEYFYYFDAIGQPIQYSKEYIQRIVGTRVSVKLVKTSQWMNQIIRIINIYTTIGMLKSINGNFVMASDSLWSKCVSNLLTNPRKPAYSDLGMTIYIARVGYHFYPFSIFISANQPFEYTPYEDTKNIYSYLTSDILTMFYCTKYVGSNTVYQPLNGMVENKYNIWKIYKGKTINKPITIDNWITKEDIVKDNTFIQPWNNKPVICYASAYTFLKDITFAFHNINI